MSGASGHSGRAGSARGWARAWPARPASWGLGRRHSPGTSRPPPRRPAPGLAWPPGFVTALVPACEAPGRRVPGGLRAQGSPTLERPSCERLRVPAGAPGAGLARWARTRLGYGTGEVWGRGTSGDRAAPHGRVWRGFGCRALGVSGTRWESECPPCALRPAPGAG